MPLTQQELARLQELEAKDQEARDRARLAELEAKAGGGGGVLANAAGFADNVVRQAANAATLGFGDEIAAGGNAAVEWAKNKLTGGPDASFGDLYDRNLSAERSRDKAFEAEHPYVSTGAQVAGAVGSALAAAPVAGATRLGAAAAQLPSLVRNVGGGMAIGAASGFGGGEGGLDNRLSGAAVGAGIGGIAGGAIPPVVNALSAAAAPVLSRFRAGTTLAQEKLAQAIERDGLTPGKVLENVRKLGPEATIADAAGDNTLALGSVVANTPGKAKVLAGDVLRARQEGQGDRILSKAERSLDNTADYYANVDDLLARRETAARPLYDKVMKPDNLVPDEMFGPLAADPFMSKTIQSVKGDPLYGMGEMADNALPVLDAAKKRLDDMIESARRSGENNRARLLTERKQALVSATDGAFPDYAAARAAWEGPTRALDALAKGREFVKSDAEITAKDIAKMTPTDREFFKAGVVRQIRDVLYNAPDGADAVKRLFGNKMKREKLETAFGDKAAFDDFARTMNAEATFYRTNSFINSGSRTTPMAMAAADATQSPVPGALMKAAMGNKVGALMDVLSQGSGRAPAKLPERVANPLAELLFSTNQQGNAAALQGLLGSPAPLAASRSMREGIARGFAAEGGLLGAVKTQPALLGGQPAPNRR